MKTRQERWLERGYTKDQIENHLSFERYKSKQTRERRIKNNVKNKDILDEIKTLFLNVKYNYTDKSVLITRISPTSDGKGFWYSVEKEFKDGSKGSFREFCFFDDFNPKEFKEYLFL